MAEEQLDTTEICTLADYQFKRDKCRGRLFQNDNDDKTNPRTGCSSGDFTRERRGAIHISSDQLPNEPPQNISLIPEGGWGWAICASSFAIQFMILGINNSFGVLFSFLLDEFGKSKGVTAWIGSAAVGIMYLIGPITCGLNERVGCRMIAFIGGILCILGLLFTSFVTDFYKIYVTYSILWGLGSSLCYFSTLTAPGEYFCHRLSLANGIITSGSGLGTLTFGPLMQFLLNKYGLATTLRILSAVMCLLPVVSLTFKRFQSPLEQAYNIKRKPEPFIDMKIWKNKAFVVYSAAVFLFMLGYFVPYVHVVNFVGYFGISKSDGVMLIGYMSISSTVSRLIFGKLSDFRYVNRLYMTQFSMIGYGIINLLFPLLKSYSSFVVVMIVLGLFEGLYVVLIAVVITDIVGVHKLNQALGNLYGLISFAIIGGPPFAGFLYDSLLSYNTAFYVCGVTTIFSSFMLSFVPWLIRRHSGRKFERDSVESRVGSLFTLSMPSHDQEKDSQQYILSRSGSKKQLSTTNLEGCDSLLTVKKVLSRQRTVSFASDTEKETASTRKRSVSYHDNQKMFLPTIQISKHCKQRSFSLDCDRSEVLKVPRRRSVSYTDGEDPEDSSNYIYDSEYELDSWTVFDSNSSSGCFLSNTLNTSVNTSFNSTLSHQGSKTKLLLSQYNAARCPKQKLSRLSTTHKNSMRKLETVV